MNIKVLFFSFFLLFVYSFSSYFFPEYIVSEVFHLNEIEIKSDLNTADLIEEIDQSEAQMTREMVKIFIYRANTIEKQRITDTRQVIDLVQSHSMILPAILLIQLGALISLVRTRNET